MFIWATFWPGMIFGGIRDLLANLNEKLKQPLFECPVCMCPYYGSILYWIIWGESVKEWLIVVFAAAGMNAVFVKLFPPEIEE